MNTCFWYLAKYLYDSFRLLFLDHCLLDSDWVQSLVSSFRTKSKIKKYIVQGWQQRGAKATFFDLRFHPIPYFIGS